MQSYVVCIPTYRRYKICANKTLASLRDARIVSDRIYVYVADETEAALYKAVLDPTSYNKIVVGALGLIQQRAFIESQWPVGQPILFMDDDITKIDLSLSLLPTKTLDEFITYAFAECNKVGSHIWGTYAVYNPYFRKDRLETTTGLNFIVGCFYGVINRPNYAPIQLNITTGATIKDHKEDVERTIKYFLEDGVVLRFNRIGVMTRYYGTDGGGMGRYNARVDAMRAAAEALNVVYPKMGSIKIRKNGIYEFVLRKI